MVIFFVALIGWLVAGYGAVVVALGLAAVDQGAFPEYGLEPSTEGFLWPLVCILLWPYTLWKARPKVNGRLGDDDNPHF